MKSTQPFFKAAALALAATSINAWALTVPVAEDTVTSTVSGTEVLKASSGKASTLPINAKQRALVRFKLSDPDVVPSSFAAGNIKSAVLRLYFVGARPAGWVSIYAITSDWSETLSSSTAAVPTIGASEVASISPADIAVKRYVCVDVTSAVVSALQSGNDFGFAIATSDPVAKMMLSSKEGPGAGYSVQLDIDANLATDGDGIFYSGTKTLLHSSGTSNFFTGLEAGNLTLTGEGNTGIGPSALKLDTTGDYNTAIGNLSLSKNMVGHQNTGVGASTLENNTSGFNTALGAFALASNTSGSSNTAVGAQALFSNTTGTTNTATGKEALLTNSTGSNNTANGYNALKSSDTGYSNTAVGASAMSGNDTGYENTVVGKSAMVISGAGYQNTAVGTWALYTSGDCNSSTAIGYKAGYSATGSGNIIIGANAGSALGASGNNIIIDNAGANADASTIRIGDTQTRAFMAGIRGVTTGVNNGIAVLVDSSGQLGTVSSSRRYKESIQDMGDASQRLLGLRPVTFRYKKPYDDGSKPLQFGLIAEEVAEVFPELAVYNDKGQPETVKYQDIAAILLNEFLKEHKRVQEQARINAEQSKRITAQEQAEASYKKQLAEQREQIQLMGERLAAMARKMETIAQQVDGRRPVAKNASARKQTAAR